MLCAAKTGRTRLQKVSNFQEPILRTQLFFYLLISRKAWKSFMVMTTSCDSRKPSWHWQKTSTKNRHMITCIAPSPKSHISLCVSLEQLLRAIWCAVSWAAVLILPPRHLTFNYHVVHFWKSAPWTYLFIHSSPNSFPTCLQWDSHEDKSRPWNVRGSALTLYSPGAWKHPLWATRLHPFTAECTRSKYHRQTWSHILMMEKATKQKAPMSLNHPLNVSKPEDSPDPEGALQEEKISFYYDENPHSLFFISIAPRINWETSLRTEDPEDLSMRKILWTLNIENTSPADIKRSFKGWSKDLYRRKDTLLLPHLFLKNHDFHFSFQCLRKYELQLL